MSKLLYTCSFFLLCFFHLTFLAKSQSFIGINYGQVADNLPAPEATAKLLQSTSIQKVRLYGSDPAMIKALANTGIGIMIGVANGDIPAMATDPSFAKGWLSTNVLPFYPASKIILINVGNEVMLSNDQNLMTNLLPAMQNLQNSLNEVSIGGKIKVSTVHAMAVLQNSEPPSSGSFDPKISDLLKGLLEFNKATGSPFAVNPYPYFAYQSDPRPDTLAFCLFQPNSGRFDAGTKITYTSMFDAQVDAVRSALNALGFKEVEIVVAETGWPYKGDSNEIGPSIENAKAYNGNMIAHLRSMVGTPLMPGISVDTYLFALYDEDLKPGPTSERSFGLFKPDLTMTYDAGLSKANSKDPMPKSPEPAPKAPEPTAKTPVQTPKAPEPMPRTAEPTPKASEPTPKTSEPMPKTPVTPSSPEAKVSIWCMPKAGVSDVQLQANIDYVCGMAGADCSEIQPGGACFEPTTVASHAAYAMNIFYQTSERNPGNCDFSQTAFLSSTNPSYNYGCSYPSGSY